jgi:formate-dependent phosphoribosylglycinamide formyltransferase (GAR transformylase)
MNVNTNNKMVIFVGSLSNKYIEAFKKEGYSIGFFRDLYDTDIDKFLPNYLHKLSFVYAINMKNKVTISESLKNLHFNSKTLLVCVREKHVYTTALIAQALNLDQSEFLNVGQAQYLTNKYFQRKEIAKIYPEITPQFKKFHTFHGAYTFTRKYGFPVVVKPANLSKGELVNICNNIEELSRKVSYVLDHIQDVYDRDKVYRKPQVVIEEFIDGKQFSVDSYIDASGNVIHTPICKQIISHDLGFDDFQTYYSQYPSELGSEEEKQVLETVEKSIKALKIVSSTTHTEVKIDSNGSCKVIEVNIRPGGFRSEMLKESYNINHFGNFIKSLLGEQITLDVKFLKYSACPQFWADKEGGYVNIENIENIKNLKSFKKFITVVKEGDLVGPVNKGFGRVAYAILAHGNKKVLELDLIQIRKLVKIYVS